MGANKCVIRDGNIRVVPSDAVRPATSRFKPVPPEYVVLPPFGDGTTRYPSREEAWDSIREVQ